MRFGACRRIPRLWRGWIAGVCLVVLATGLVSAHETDQYSLPLDREFADLGPQFSRWIHRVIERAVDKTNARIKQAIDDKRPASEIEALHSPDEIAKAVNKEFPWAMDVIEGLDRLVLSEKMKQRYPGQVVGYKEPLTNIYQGAHLPIDPRQLFRVWLGCTMKVYDVYLGSDKIGHFTDMGMNYYRDYRKALRDGKSDEQAIRHAVNLGTHGLIFSERGMLGFMTAGSYSNGDLAANYVGLLFYINLTQPVMLKGQKRPALLVRDGPYWKLAPHVRRDSDFFAWFISDHFNEALNPSLREGGMRNHFRKAIKARTHLILSRYRDELGNPRPREWYEQTTKDLMTYYGQDYGHEGRLDELLPISSVCFDASNDNHSAQPLMLSITNGSPPPNALHLLALDRTGRNLAIMLDQGVNVNQCDTDGQTALHRAAAAGNRVAAGELLQHAADVHARDRFNTTPLHLAAGQKNAEVVKLLIDQGADLGARDDFGVTPLHDAARAGSEETVQLLLTAGANPNVPDAYGNTPLHLACRYNRDNIADLLIRKGANLHARNAAGSTPLHEAAFAGDRTIAKMLLSRGVSAKAKNQSGQTPAQVASSRGYDRVMDFLNNK